MGTLPLPGSSEKAGIRVGDKVFSDQELKGWWASTGGDPNKIAADAVANNATRDQIAQAIAVGKAQNNDMSGVQYTDPAGKSYGGGQAVERHVTDLMPDYEWGENAILQKKATVTPNITTPGVTTGGATGGGGNTAGGGAAPMSSSAPIAPILAKKAELSPEAMSSNQVTGILSKSSPFRQYYETQGRNMAAARGMDNSLMAESMGLAEATKAATPFALQDANTVGTADLNYQNYLQNQAQLGYQGQISSGLQAQQDKAALERVRTQEDATTARLNIEKDSNLKIASMNLAAKDQEYVQNAIRSNGDTYQRVVSDILSNKDLTEEARGIALDTAFSTYQTTVNMTSSLAGIQLQWN